MSDFFTSDLKVEFLKIFGHKKAANIGRRPFDSASGVIKNIRNDIPLIDTKSNSKKTTKSTSKSALIANSFRRSHTPEV